MALMREVHCGAALQVVRANHVALVLALAISTAIAMLTIVSGSVAAAPALPQQRAVEWTIVHVKHVAPHTCGVSSSKFARICRPGAHTSCMGAVSRNVKGFSPTFCTVRRTACTTCLTALKLCIKRIGHGPRNQFSCDECTGKFSRCIGKRYPQVR